MISKEEALIHGITDAIWNTAREKGYVLRRVVPSVNWELKSVREKREKLIRDELKLLAAGADIPLKDEAIICTTDNIMEALDNFVED